MLVTSTRYFSNAQSSVSIATALLHLKDNLRYALIWSLWRLVWPHGLCLGQPYRRVTHSYVHQHDCNLFYATGLHPDQGPPCREELRIAKDVEVELLQAMLPTQAAQFLLGKPPGATAITLAHVVACPHAATPSPSPSAG